MDNNGMCRLSVREFQVIGPATEKARIILYVLRSRTWTCCSVERRLDDVWRTVVDYERWRWWPVCNVEELLPVKPGFHYPSSQPKFTGQVDGPWTWAHFLTPELRGVKKCTRVDLGAFFDTRQLGPSTRVSKNAPEFTGNRALDASLPSFQFYCLSLVINFYIQHVLYSCSNNVN